MANDIEAGAEVHVSTSARLKRARDELRAWSEDMALLGPHVDQGPGSEVVLRAMELARQQYWAAAQEYAEAVAEIASTRPAG